MTLLTLIADVIDEWRHLNRQLVLDLRATRPDLMAAPVVIFGRNGFVALELVAP